jgi:hypothetical protein
VSAVDASFDTAVERALAGALPGVFPAAAVTTVVADPSEPAPLAAALARLLAILPRAGVPRGRVTVLMAADARGAAWPRARARELRAALGVPVLVHDPERSACFTAGRVDGVAVELCDELREAEAVLTVGALAAADAARATAALVVPGLAGAATRRWLAATPGALARARALVRVDLALGWALAGEGTWNVRADGRACP